MESCQYVALSAQARKNVESSEQYKKDLSSIFYDLTVDEILSSEEFRGMLPRTTKGYEQYKEAMGKINRSDLLDTGKVYLSEKEKSAESPKKAQSVTVEPDGTVVVEEPKKDKQKNEYNFKEPLTKELYLSFVEQCILYKNISKFINLCYQENINKDELIKETENLTNFTSSQQIKSGAYDFKTGTLLLQFLSDPDNAKRFIKDVKEKYDKIIADTFNNDYNGYITECIKSADKADLVKLVSLYDTKGEIDQIAKVGRKIAYRAMADFEASSNDNLVAIQKRLNEDLESVIESLITEYKKHNTNPIKICKDNIPMLDQMYTDMLKNANLSTDEINSLNAIFNEYKNRILSGENQKPEQDQQSQDQKNAFKITEDTFISKGFDENMIKNHKFEIDKISELANKFTALKQIIGYALDCGRFPEFVDNTDPEDKDHNTWVLNLMDSKFTCINSFIIDNKYYFGNNLNLLVQNPNISTNNTEYKKFIPLSLTTNNSDGKLLLKKCIEGKFTKADADEVLKNLPSNYADLVSMMRPEPFKDIVNTNVDLADMMQYKKVLEQFNSMIQNLESYGIINITNGLHAYFKDIGKGYAIEVVFVNYIAKSSTPILTVKFGYDAKHFNTKASGDREEQLPYVNAGKSANKKLLKFTY